MLSVNDAKIIGIRLKQNRLGSNINIFKLEKMSDIPFDKINAIERGEIGLDDLNYIRFICTKLKISFKSIMKNISGYTDE